KWVVDVKGEVVVELAGHLGRTEKLLGISQLRNQPRWRALPAVVVVVVKLCQKITGVRPDEAGDRVEVHRPVAQVDEGYTDELLAAVQNLDGSAGVESLLEFIVTRDMNVDIMLEAASLAVVDGGFRGDSVCLGGRDL